MAPPRKTLTHVASATSTGSTISWPAGIQAGDIAILVDNAMATGSNPTNVVPGAMTQVDTTTDSASLYNIRRTISRRICTGSESGSMTGLNGSGKNAKTLTILRPNWALGYGSHVGSSVVVSTSNPSARSVSPGVNVAPLLAVGSKFSDTNGSLTMSGGDGVIAHQVNAGSNQYSTAFKWMLNPGDEATIAWDAGSDGNWTSVGATLIKLT